MAFTLLDNVLQRAEQEGHIRVFLDCGPPMVALLSLQSQKYKEQARKAGSSADLSKMQAFVGLLLDEFSGEDAERTSPHKETLSSQSTAFPGSDLSQRELDVLRGIVKGLSTQEIAQQMIVAESTIKWHVKNIYGKLHVHNRVQAIIEARKLHLI